MVPYRARIGVCYGTLPVPVPFVLFEIREFKSGKKRPFFGISKMGHPKSARKVPYRQALRSVPNRQAPGIFFPKSYHFLIPSDANCSPESIFFRENLGYDKNCRFYSQLKIMTSPLVCIFFCMLNFNQNLIPGLKCNAESE